MILLYTILITSTLYLAIARAKVGQPIRDLMPLSWRGFFDCAMCSGAWYGLAVSMAAVLLGHDYPGLTDGEAPIVCFFGSAAWTPILSALVQRALVDLGQAIIDEEGCEVIDPDGISKRSEDE